MKQILLLAIIAICLLSCNSNKIEEQETEPIKFFKVQEMDIIDPNGEIFFIKGTNLGNWLNPEGYMFGFKKTNSPRFINEMFCQLVGSDFTAEFWKAFKDNYITRDDIRFIKQTGSNTVRVPFHYKLFTDEDYMGLTSAQDGFARLDSVINWCREEGLYVILDMHDAPGGQSGDNIDDSYGYPWLFESETSQQLFCDIWRKIADYYKDEPIILGYDLMNEPIAHFFENKAELNEKLEGVYKMAVAAVREVDKNHIVILGGAQWNSIFEPFTDWTFDDNMMYSCHRYGGDATKKAIGSFIAFRDSTGLPMFMGELGHNTYEWLSDFANVMKENNIGYTYWPYKKIDNSCFAAITPPENWDKIVAFSEGARSTYKEIRENRPDQAMARKAMTDFIEASKFRNNVIQEEYIEALRLNE